MYTDKQVDDILAYITITKDYDYAQNTLNILSKCKCCSVHNHNKPTIFQPWFEMTYKPDVKCKNCYCNCRRVSRFICRLSTNNFIGKQQNPRPYTSQKNNNHNQLEIATGFSFMLLFGGGFFIGPIAIMITGVFRCTSPIQMIKFTSFLRRSNFRVQKNMQNLIDLVSVCETE